MPTKYPAQIDNSISLPPAVDNLTPVGANDINALRDAIISIQSELGTKPSGTYSTVKNRITQLENIFNDGGGVSLSGDLGGTSTDVEVIGLRKIPISPVAPTTGQALVFNGSEYAPAAASIQDATGSQKGVLQLAGDLTGTASSPTVLAIQNYAIRADTPQIDQVLQFDGTLWGPADVSFVPNDATTSTKGIIQLTGDLSGSATNPTVVSIRGITISEIPPTSGQVLTASSPSFATWETPSATVGDATSGSNGIIRLSGDLAGVGGTAASPRVSGINSTTVSAGATAGQVLRATGTNTAGFGSLDLSLAATVGSSILPSANMTSASTSVTGIIRLTTDLAGTATAPTVVGITGASNIATIRSATINYTGVANVGANDQIAYVQTTDATVTTLATVATVTGRVQNVDVMVIGRNGTTQGAVYKRSMCVRNAAGTLTMVGSVDNTDTKEDNNLWDCTLSISGANILVRVQGVAATVISWGARISVTNV